MSSWGYQVTRKESGRFDNRGSYLQARAGSVPNPQLCQVMEAMVAGLDIRERTRRGRSEGPAGDPFVDLDLNWAGLPWLTPVLGSGCLELPDDPQLTPEALGAKIRRRLTAVLGTNEDERPEGAAPFSARAARFAEELATDRIHPAQHRPRRASHPNAHQTEEVSSVDRQEAENVAARVVLIATLVTEFFYRVKGVSGGPLSRWNEDKATLPKATPSLVDVMEDVVRPALEQIETVRGALESNPSLVEQGLDGPVCSVLQDVHKGLDRRESPTVTFAHLRLITDVAWYVLTQGSTIYPGWSDLLLGLMLREGQTGPQRFPRTRPRLLNLHSVPKLVENLYMPPTRRSWNTAVGLHATDATPSHQTSTPDEPVTGRDRLYARVADVLWAQTRALRATNVAPEPSFGVAPGMVAPTNTPLPPASAFVTSFDIELDMALWLRAIEADASEGGPGWLNGRDDERADLAPFYVVVPVHVLRHEDDEHAALCWLRGRIQPDRTLGLDMQLERIRRPQDWTLLTPNSVDARQLLDGPHVVHLSGSPLFELPKRGDAAVARLVEDLRAVHVRIDDPESICLEHAVTVDEYLAFRQSEVELLWSAQKAKSKEDRRSRGLHPFLLASSRAPSDPGQNPRFWVAFGVPVADAAVRHRIVSQFTLRHLLALADDATGGRAGEPGAPNASGRLGRSATQDDAGGTVRSAVSPGSGGRLGTPPSIGVMDPPEGGTDVSAERTAAQASRHHLDGVVVNRRINDDEASILYWVGLDVVIDDARSFIKDLEHYARHLEIPPRRPSPTKECPLVREARS